MLNGHCPFGVRMFLVSSIFDLSSPFLFFFSFSLFLGDSWLLDGSSQRAVKNNKPTSHSGELLQSYFTCKDLAIFLKFNNGLPGNDTVKFGFSCLFL